MQHETTPNHGAAAKLAEPVGFLDVDYLSSRLSTAAMAVTMIDDAICAGEDDMADRITVLTAALRHMIDEAKAQADDVVQRMQQAARKNA